ncbi:progonadoliberin-1-like [Eucyclogobius newberryi]|uniref:progonadoliberin-1-like n=1 Tax=Eucyclogobius newberryi TaxID=166745 RepID=UPI003B5BB7CB
MACKSSALRLWVFGLITSQVWSQHWSFGLSPGGKRELNGLSQTLSNIVERFQPVDARCSVVGCDEELPKIYRLKGILDNVADMDNGHRAFKK